MEVTVDEMLALLGAKEIEIMKLKAAIAALQEQVRTMALERVKQASDETG